MTGAAPIEHHRDDGFVVSTERARLDLDAIHAFLVTAYWSRDIARERMERAIANSIPFGLCTQRETSASTSNPSRRPSWISTATSGGSSRSLGFPTAAPKRT